MGPKIEPKKYPSSATTHKWWTERKKLGSKNRIKKISIVGPQPINGGLKEKSVWVRKSDSKNIHRRATTHKWWTERKIGLGPKIGLKKYPSSATTHKWWTERKKLGSKNRIQKISIVGPQPTNDGLEEKSVWVRKSDPKNIHRRPQPINGGLKEKSVWVRKSDSKNIHRRPQPINGGLKEKSVWVRKSDSKNIHRRPQPINGGLKEKSVWVRKSDPNNIHRRPQPINGGLKGKNLGPKIGLKKYLSSSLILRFIPTEYRQ